MSESLWRWPAPASVSNMPLNCQDRRSMNMSICPLILSFLWPITTVWKMLMSLAARKRLSSTASLSWQVLNALPRILRVNIWHRQLRPILALCFCQRKVSIRKLSAIQPFLTVCGGRSRLWLRGHLPSLLCSIHCLLALKRSIFKKVRTTSARFWVLSNPSLTSSVVFWPRLRNIYSMLRATLMNY